MVWIGNLSEPLNWTLLLRQSVENTTFPVGIICTIMKFKNVPQPSGYSIVNLNKKKQVIRSFALFSCPGLLVVSDFNGPYHWEVIGHQKNQGFSRNTVLNRPQIVK